MADGQVNMNKLLLYTAGSASKEVQLVIEQANQERPTWEIVGFVDEDPELVGKEVASLPVFGPDHKERAGDVFGLCPVLDPTARRRITEELIEGQGLKLATFVYPSVRVPRDLEIGGGTIVMPDVLFGYNVRLGKGVLAWWRTLLGHDLRVGDYASILSSANITAGCTIGRNSTIGTGATLTLGVKVGDNAIVGIGTTVFHNVDDNKSIVAMPRMLVRDR